MRRIFNIGVLLLFLSLNGSLMAQNLLRVLDPQNQWNWNTGSITEAVLTLRPEGLYMQYGLYLTFAATDTYFDYQTNLEVVLDFTLPEGSIVLDNWLWVGNDIIQGKIIDRWSASEIYEGIVNRRRDPSILYKEGANNYQLRVYPMKTIETRKVKLTYLVPVKWMKGKVEADLPKLLLASSKTDPDLHLFVWESNGFNQPGLNVTGQKFYPAVDDEFGEYKGLSMKASSLPETAKIQMNSPSINGMFLSTFEKNSDKYYQLSIEPGNLIDTVEQKKTLILFDFELVNSTLNKSQVVQVLKDKLLSSAHPGDLFNLGYSRLNNQFAFEDWMPITSENFDAAFAGMLSNTIYSNLSGLLADGMQFIKDHQGGSVLLVANSDNITGFEQANSLVEDLKKLYDPLPHVFIADFQNKGYGSYYIGNRYYQGQEYLYINLSKRSGGSYRSIRETMNSSTISGLDEILGEILDETVGLITAFDLYTTPTDGFCYGRLGDDENENVSINRAITQVGKYFGVAPFTVYLTGIFDTHPFSKLVIIPEQNIFPGDSLVSKMWHGRYIAELEGKQQTNPVIQEVLYESLNHRILSKYSAFLCLEPSDSVAVCVTCLDESRLTGIDHLLEGDSTHYLEVYPNPFQDKLTIQLEIPVFSKTEEVVVQVLSILGQKVFQHTAFGRPGEKVVIEWEGNLPSGDPVPAGNYYVMVRAGSLMLNKQVVKL